MPALFTPFVRPRIPPDPVTNVGEHTFERVPVVTDKPARIPDPPRDGDFDGVGRAPGHTRSMRVSQFYFNREADIGGFAYHGFPWRDSGGDQRYPTTKSVINPRPNATRPRGQMTPFTEGRNFNQGQYMSYGEYVDYLMAAKGFRQ